MSHDQIKQDIIDCIKEHGIHVAVGLRSREPLVLRVLVQRYLSDIEIYDPEKIVSKVQDLIKENFPDNEVDVAYIGVPRAD